MVVITEEQYVRERLKPPPYALASLVSWHIWRYGKREDWKPILGQNELGQRAFIGRISAHGVDFGPLHPTYTLSFGLGPMGRRNYSIVVEGVVDYHDADPEQKPNALQGLHNVLNTESIVEYDGLIDVLTKEPGKVIARLIVTQESDIERLAFFYKVPEFVSGIGNGTYAPQDLAAMAQRDSPFLGPA